MDCAVSVVRFGHGDWAMTETEAAMILFGLVVLVHLLPVPLWIGFSYLRAAAGE